MQSGMLIGEGRTASVYREGMKAIKIYGDIPMEAVRAEAEKQAFAHKAGLPVPEVYGVYPVDGGCAIEMAYVPGRHLMERGMDRDARMAALQALVRLQCEVHAKSGEGLPKFTDRLANRISGMKQLDAATTEALLAHLTRLDAGQCRLCHGDFHPLNILADGDALWIIDWMDAAAGEPLVDACRTYLILRQAIPRMAGIYLRLYCGAAEVCREDVLAWLPILAAARLVEDQTDKEAAIARGIVNEWMQTEKEKNL